MKIREGNGYEYALKVINDCSNMRYEYAMPSLGRSLCAASSEDASCGKVSYSWHHGPHTADVMVALYAWQGTPRGAKLHLQCGAFAQ